MVSTVDMMKVFYGKIKPVVLNHPFCKTKAVDFNALLRLWRSRVQPEEICVYTAGI